MAAPSVPASAPSTTLCPPARVHVAPTTPADLPAAVECELLAFSGAFPPFERSSHLMSPFRAPLVRAGVHPRLWPDFNPTVRRHARRIRDGMLFFTAFVPNGDDDEGGNGACTRVVGLAALERPRSDVTAARMKRGWTGRLLDDYVYPSMDTVEDKLWSSGPTGTNVEFRKVAKDAMNGGRDMFTSKRECYILHMLIVHPHFQRRGVGSALLAHCIALADTRQVPLYLEASRAGAPLYAARGFKMLRMLRVEYKDEVIELPVMVREPTGTQEVPPSFTLGGEEVGVSEEHINV
ncbi:hypothetical protein M0805_008568 [Coniferiporia weirii]|nr:hypothetical protein M0805_008568 [Coniferiporia weirii]